MKVMPSKPSTEFLDEKLLPSLRDAAGAGLEKLSQYHIKARHCQYNVIATMLHPCLGISWFRKVDPSGNRATHAETLFKHAFDGYKAAEPVPAPSAPKTTPSSSSFLDEICMVDAVEDMPPVMAVSEVDHYFQADCMFGRGDPNGPLLWWKTHERDFPIISKMARDFLAIPGTSVSVERLFSKSRHLCLELRSSMKADTIMHSLLCKTWIKDGLFRKVLCGLS